VTKSSDRISRQEKKIKKLELELNDLRQGLAILKDYYRDLELFSEDREAAIHLKQVVVRPLLDDEREFNGIWKFHREVLIPDPSAHISYAEMYDAFMEYCRKEGSEPVEQELFEYLFARMKNPTPVFDRGEWKGCRLLTEKG
jgi:DICT domain-containing protein